VGTEEDPDAVGLDRRKVERIWSSARDLYRSGVHPAVQLCLDAISDARTLVKPGTLLAYHAVSGGFILGEIVHRVSGKTIREVLAEQMLDPLGFRWGNYGVAPEDIDLSLGFPTRFSYGLMLGAKVLSLYGRDTDLAFGHLGFINIMGWADPERGISGGLINSGKAIVYSELPRFYGLMQRIASTVPEVTSSERMI
jgi:CubicO group peptidase (beta-lactamase class C family)